MSDYFEEKDNSSTAWAEFDKLVGLEMKGIKNQIERAVKGFKEDIKEAEAARANGENPDRPFMNMQFLGDPGTGKTTVARLVGRLMRAEGILPTSKYVEIKAGDLLSSHPGDVKNALIKAADEANGGVLFIDEFYSFNSPIQ